MYRISTDEMETTIVISKNDKLAKVYSCDPIYMRKLDKLCEKCPDEYKLVSEDGYSKTYSVPKKRIRFARAVLKKDNA